MGVESVGGGGDRGTRPPVKISGGDVPSKKTLENLKSNYFQRFQAWPSQVSSQSFDCRGDIGTNEAKSRTCQSNKNTCPSTDPTRKRPLKCVPPSQKCVATPLGIRGVRCVLVKSCISKWLSFMVRKSFTRNGGWLPNYYHLPRRAKNQSIVRTARAARRGSKCVF